jgi:hypothetical protein
VGDLIFVSFFLGGKIGKWGGFFFFFCGLKKKKKQLLIWVRFVAMNGMRRVVSNGHFGQMGNFPTCPRSRKNLSLWMT